MSVRLPPHAVVAEAWPPGDFPQIRLTCQRPRCPFVKVLPNLLDPHELAWIGTDHEALNGRRPVLSLVPSPPPAPAPWWRRRRPA